MQSHQAHGPHEMRNSWFFVFDLQFLLRLLEDDTRLSEPNKLTFVFSQSEHYKNGRVIDDILIRCAKRKNSDSISGTSNDVSGDRGKSAN